LAVKPGKLVFELTEAPDENIAEERETEFQALEDGNSLNIVVETSEVLNFSSLVRTFMNDTAVSYGYSSSDNFISYYNSGITAWRNEAIAFNTWRDNTETLMYDNIFSFTADGITLPDLAGFTGQTGYFDVGITASRPNLFS